ncbi:hypothetical protein [Streptomyces sp. FH025]|uniref:hypothetical protein n=1 Tax=Streptomyces sp. FH025 TaxID=2815937 RepID=UPI001A9ECFD3|nr:hypothetical protein [Streptomyces sp. FH025]MBO1416617.1 hypothetical protein [Streptomyces sp. FH025]
MNDDLVANPQVTLEVFLSVRRRGRPVERVRLTAPAELALLPALLAGQQATPQEKRQAAVRLGLLLPPDEAPARLEELRLRCDVDEELLALLPPRAAGLPVPDAAELRVNPDLHVQYGPELPQAVAADAPEGHAVVSGPRDFAAERPVVWLRDARSGTVVPWWCDGTWGPDLRRVALEGAPPAALSREALRALWLAGVLVPRTPLGPPAAPAEESGDGVLVLRGVFPPLFVAALRRHFRRMRREGCFSTDRQQVLDGLRDGMYCDAVTLFVQRQLARAVTAWAGEPVRPSYTWAVTYQPGAALAPHRDRPQCRWNVSLCVDDDPAGADPWPFRIRTADRLHEVALGMGDAVVYSGTDDEHWRDPLPAGRHVTMCLLHYVAPDFTGPLN